MLLTAAAHFVARNEENVLRRTMRLFLDAFNEWVERWNRFEGRLIAAQFAARCPFCGIWLNRSIDRQEDCPYCMGQVTYVFGYNGEHRCVFDSDSGINRYGLMTQIYCRCGHGKIIAPLTASEIAETQRVVDLAERKRGVLL
jgi:hypothetical protein